ncbi:MAG: hypothetical protein JRG82_17995 [Deltaproteobacteria bacterium]|nr:hypothetical protein [Deltaproteobacteria bacterium]
MKAATALFLGLLLPVTATAVPSTGNPVVYHSPDGLGTRPSGSPPEILAKNGQQIYLFIDYENDPDGGTSGSAGTMCVDKDGDETCGFDVLLVMTTDTATFATFTPASGNIIGQIDSNTHTSLRVNGIDVNGLGVEIDMAIPAEIGTLTVDALDANQLQIEVKGVHRVGAAGQLDAIQPQVIVNLPEPAGDLLLMCGIAGLAALYRLRHRHPRRVTAV